jgi:hypothetical protein
MSFFQPPQLLLRWYTKKLQSHPYWTNSISAVLLMTVGDVVAQTMEQQHRRRRSVNNDADGGSTTTTTKCSVVAAAVQSLDDQKYDDSDDRTAIDWVRTSTMAVWSGALYAPFFVYLYRRVFDRYLPLHGVAGIGGRVIASVVVSIPVNATFFLYGSLAHHGIMYLQQQQEHGNGGIVASSCQNHHHHDTFAAPTAATTSPRPPHPSFLARAVWTTAQDKWRTELCDTIFTSAQLWVPINLINFSIVPMLYRPLVLMAGSAGWNCYLSLSQHRNSNG